jgi:hypothetical protein
MGRLDLVSVPGKGFLLSGAFIAQNTWDQSNHGVGHYSGGDRSVRKDVIANGHFFIHQCLDDAMINTLIVSAKDEEM